MKTIFKEPLLYFVLAAGLIFSIFDQVNQVDIDDNRVINVDRDGLLTFMQLRSKGIERQLLDQMLAEMPSDRKQKLINDYVREEALYREGKAFSLDEGDNLIRRRVIQKLELITQKYSDAALDVSASQIQKYYKLNISDYYVEPVITFTHVFFDLDSHSQKKAKVLAEDKLLELNSQNVSFSDGIQHGERFAFHLNYVDKTPEFIAAHFGEAMADNVFKLSNDFEQWYGPLVSPYGYHLVKLAKLEQGRFHSLAEVKQQVYDDVRREQLKKNLQDSYQQIVESYQVEIDQALLESNKLNI